jgi:hypothetical protein
LTLDTFVNSKYFKSHFATNLHKTLKIVKISWQTLKHLAAH